MPIICPSCGAENPDHADYCNLCHSTVGFECAEYTGPTTFDEGFSSKYPSSFSDDAPVIQRGPDEEEPSAAPLDIGSYGVRSGQQMADVQPSEDAAANPVDIGRYGMSSGEQPHQPTPLASDYRNDGQNASPRVVRKETRRLRKERRRG
jgi:hypothetical protein